MKIWKIGTNIQSYIDGFQSIYETLDKKKFNIIPSKENKNKFFFRTVDFEKREFWQNHQPGKSNSTLQQILSVWLSLGLIKISGQNKMIEKNELLNSTFEFNFKGDTIEEHLNNYFEHTVKNKIEDYKESLNLKEKEENPFFWQYKNEKDFYNSLFLSFLYENNIITLQEINRLKIEEPNILDYWKITNKINKNLFKDISINFIYGSYASMMISIEGYKNDFVNDKPIITNYVKPDILIDSKAKTFLDLLNWIKSGNYIIKIPIYQRKYKWTEEIIENLVFDIIKIAKHNIKKAHYLGELILHEKDISKNFHERTVLSKIVDGQQRFTSLLIIFRVVRDLMAMREIQPTQEILEYFKTNSENGDKTNAAIKIFTYARGSQDFEDFYNLMLGYRHKIYDESNFIINYKKVFFLLEKFNNQEIYNFLNVLLNNIIMTITIDKESDEFELFENMNTHKLELEILDLIRDIIMMHIDNEVLDNREESIIKYFEENIVNMFKENFKNKINSFIKAFIKIFTLNLDANDPLYKKIKNFDKDTDLYKNFKEIIKYLINQFSISQPRKMNYNEFEELIDYLHKYIKLYLNIIDPKKYFDPNNEFYLLGDILSCFERRDIYNPIIMYLIEKNSTYKNKRYKINDINYLRSLLFAFENYEMRFQIVIYRGQSLTRILDNLLKRISIEEKITYDFLVSILTSSDIMGNLSMPSLESFYKILSENSLLTDKVVTKLCARLEFYLDNNYSMDIKNLNHKYFSFSSPTREHIMPQEYNKNWGKFLLSKVNNKDELIIKHKEYLNFLGNTLVINNWTNSKASNLSFKDKQEKYNEEPNVTKLKQYFGVNDHSLIQLMSIKELEEWSFKEIEKRSKQMALIFKEIYKNY